MQTLHEIGVISIAELIRFEKEMKAMEAERKAAKAWKAMYQEMRDRMGIEAMLAAEKARYEAEGRNNAIINGLMEHVEMERAAGDRLKRRTNDPS